MLLNVHLKCMYVCMYIIHKKLTKLDTCFTPLTTAHTYINVHALAIFWQCLLIVLLFSAL